MNVSIPFEQGDVFRHKLEDRKYPLNEVSIPFEQGDVFRPTSSTTSCSSCIVSIPFEQGDVFRHLVIELLFRITCCLNPFRAGRCLSTEIIYANESFESQSLSSRAMSFDLVRILKMIKNLLGLNPFRAGRCLSTEREERRSNSS